MTITPFIDELEHLHSWRNREAFGGEPNSLAEWMNSEEWLTPNPDKSRPEPVNGEILPGPRCRYRDCRYPLASPQEQVTCSVCRDSLGLPPLGTS